MFLRFPRKGSPAPASPRDQAKAFLAAVGRLDRSDLPGTIDVEFPGAGRSETGLTARQALDWVRAARNVVATQGAAPILYTSARVWKEDLDNLDAPDLVESPLWLARYYGDVRQPATLSAALFADGRHDPPIPPPWGDHDNFWMHQYRGDALGVPGMSNTVDLNRFNSLREGTRGERVKWTQRRLGIPPSGHFDDAMARAVIAYQRDHQLDPDGVIGPRTFARLCWELPA